jgi:glycosyltransferase involved in cell wall biosynthesis/peptidoglycan/xylan/chitin deacetylase (PgdA/CDA1 family)
MTHPLVSVVIATYNAGVYLREAIESVLGQSVGDLELLVVDDGSTDGTRELVEQIHDARLTYLWQENAGQTSAKNHGVSKARGDFIGFCDGDDYWYKNKLELQLPLFERSPAVGVVYSAADEIDEHGKQLGRALVAAHRGVVTHELFMRNFVPFGTAVVRRQCVERLGAFDSALRMGIDWDLWLRVSAHYEFEFVAQSTYAYRIWSGQMSKNWRGRYSSAFRIMEKFVTEHPDAISANLRRKAFADTYANRARARRHEHPMGAIGDGARAVLLDPLQPYSWKTFGRVLKEAVAPPAPASSERHLLKRALAPAVTALTSNRPRLLMYHRFSEQPQKRALAAADFRKQMQLLKERCEVLTLAELMSRDPAGAGKPAAVITVDDGYADFFEIGFPILQELGLPATVFVATGFIDGRMFLWPDYIRALLEVCPFQNLKLEGAWQGQQISLRDAEEREAAWHRLADQLVFTTTDRRDRAVSDLAAAVGVPIASLDMSRYRSMTWAQLRQMSGAGFEIADHSATHPWLTTMSDEQVLEDLGGSKAQIERMLGTRVRSFAYPNGTKRDYDLRLIGLVRNLGYENAVLSTPAPVSRKRRFEIGRFSGDCTLDEFRSIVDGFGILRHSI